MDVSACSLGPSASKSAAASWGAEAYAQGERFQREKHGLFAREWLPYCAAGEIAEPGAFVSHTIGGWSMVVIRGADGTARALRNICRHQNMPVVEKQAGRCDRLRCRFHGWTYDLTGALIEAPPLVAPADPASQRLPAIELAERDGLMFVRQEPGPAPPPSLALGAGAFAAAVTTDIACNWKSAVEALLPDAGWRYVWPSAFQTSLDGGTAVRLLIPRTFTRTRIVDLLFVTPDAPVDAARSRLEVQAAVLKPAAETVQKRRTAGDLQADCAAVAAFRDRVAAGC